MTKPNLSGCLSDKQILVLNTRFDELPFELGCLLDEIFFKLLMALSDQEFCDHSDTPQDTSGEDVFVCINDGVCHFVNKADLIAQLETLTQAQYDPATHTITYIGEDGNPTVLTLNCGTAVIDPLTCELVYTDEKGVETRTAIPQPDLTFDAGTNELVWTDAKGVETRFPMNGQLDCLTSPNTLHTVCVDDDGCLVVSNLDNAVPLDNTTAEGFLAYDDQGRIKPMTLADTIDIKCVTLCDVGNDNKPYILEVTSNITQGTKTTATLELDGTTPYTVIEAGQAKPQNCELTKIYNIDTTGDVGAIENYWQIDGGVGNGVVHAAGTPLGVVFSQRDECGVIVHENAPDQTTVNLLDGARTTDPADPQIDHQAEATGFLCVPEGGAELLITQGGQSDSAMYLGICDGKLEPIYVAANSGTNPVTFLNAGVYQFKLFVHDPGTNGNARLRWRLNGGALVDVPVANIFQNMPPITRLSVWLDKDTNIATDFQGNTYDFSDPNNKSLLCNPKENTLPAQVDIGAPVELNKEYELMKVWVSDLSGATNGAIEQFWEASVSTPVGGAFNSTPIEDAFGLTDDCGLPLHENAPDATNTLNVAGVTSTESSADGVANQNQVDTYVHVPKGGARLQYQFIGTANHAVYSGQCGSKLTKKGQRTGAATIDLGFVGAGFYHVRYYVNDATQNGRGQIRWELAGASSTLIPVSNLYTESLGADSCLARVCKETGDITDVDGTDFAAGVEVFICNPCAEGSSAAAPTTDTEKKTATILGGERIVIDSTAANPTGSLTVPAGANGAFVQTLIKDEAERVHCVNYYVDGRTPTATNGFQAGHKEVLQLGCAAGNGTSSADSIDELANFILHAGEVTSGDVCIEVSYYIFP